MRSTFCQDIGQCSPVVACRLRGICPLLQLRLLFLLRSHSPTLSLSFSGLWRKVSTCKHLSWLFRLDLNRNALVVYNLLMGPALELIMPDRRTDRQLYIGHVFAHLVLSWLSGLLR